MASMVKLRDGSTITQAVLLTTKTSIDDLAQTNPYVVMELVKKCNDVAYKFNKSASVDSEAILKEGAFLTVNGKVHDDVVKVVLNYIKLSEDGQRLTPVNPLMQSKTASQLDSKTK